MISFLSIVQTGEISWVENSVVGLSFGQYVFGSPVVVWIEGMRLNRAWQELRLEKYYG